MSIGIQDIIYYITPIIGSLLPLAREEIGELFKRTRKRRLFLKILRANKNIKKFYDSISQEILHKLHPKIILITYLIVIFSSTLFFIIGSYLKFSDFKTSALILLISFITLTPIYFILILIFLITSIISLKASKEHYIYVYWMLMSLEGFIIGHLVAAYISYAYLYNFSKTIGIDESQLTKFFLLILIIFFTLLLTSIIISKFLTADIKRSIEENTIQNFRANSPCVTVATIHHTFKGKLWNFLDNDVIQIKCNGIVSIPWNEISWIEVIDTKNQNEVLIKELKKDDINKTSFWNRLLRLLKLQRKNN